MKFPPFRPRGLLPALLLALCLPAAAEVPTATLEKADALIKGGNPDEAYRLLDPLEVEGAGDLAFDYLLGTAALESGRPGRATFIYERILAINPAYVGVRADMGRAYFAQGDYPRAKIEFETVIATPNIPADLKATVEKYNKLAEGRAQGKKSSFVGYVDGGYGYDSNPNSATSTTNVYIPGIPTTITLAPPDRKASDHYLALAFGGEYNYSFDDQWGVFAGGDARGRSYRNFATVDSRGADLRTGVTYSGGRWLLKAGVTGGTFTQNDLHVRTTSGVMADWRYAVTDKTQLTVNGSVVRSYYAQENQKTANNETGSVSGGVFTSLGASSALSLTLTYGRDDATGDRADGDRSFWGPRLFVVSSFGDSLGAFFSTGASFSRYDLENALFLATRREKLYDATLGFNYALTKGLVLRPQLTYLKNDSNVELYSYDKTDLSLNLRYDF